MKIPKEQHVYYNNNVARRLLQDWGDAARQIELEYGVWIEVKTEDDNNVLSRIYFKVMEHEFENLRDLKKALEMKAFI